jgi:hypothetical protein
LRPLACVPQWSIIGTSMAHDVFISYASEDQRKAATVCAHLESGGIRCWMAPRDVLPGSSYAESIMSGITGSRVLVLVLSSQSNASPHVLREVERAANRRIAIIPFRIEDVALSPGLEYFLGSQHWLDAFAMSADESLHRLTATLRVRLGWAPTPQPGRTEAPKPIAPTSAGSTAPRALAPQPRAPWRTASPPVQDALGAGWTLLKVKLDNIGQIFPAFFAGLFVAGMTGGLLGTEVSQTLGWILGPAAGGYLAALMAGSRAISPGTFERLRFRAKLAVNTLAFFFLCGAVLLLISKPHVSGFDAMEVLLVAPFTTLGGVAERVWAFRREERKQAARHSRLRDIPP